MDIRRPLIFIVDRICRAPYLSKDFNAKFNKAYRNLTFNAVLVTDLSCISRSAECSQSGTFPEIHNNPWPSAKFHYI